VDWPPLGLSGSVAWGQRLPVTSSPLAGLDLGGVGLHDHVQPLTRDRYLASEIPCGALRSDTTLLPNIHGRDANLDLGRAADGILSASC